MIAQIDDAVEIFTLINTFHTSRDRQARGPIINRTVSRQMLVPWPTTKSPPLRDI